MSDDSKSAPALKSTSVSIEDRARDLELRNKQLQREIINMTKAQGNLYRFQERVERQKTIYAQIAETGQEFNQSLDFRKVLDATVRFVVDHLNFERCAIFSLTEKRDSFAPLAHGGFFQIELQDQLRKQFLKSDEIFGYLKKDGRMDSLQSPANPIATEIKTRFNLEHWSLHAIGLPEKEKAYGLLLFGTSKENEHIHNSTIEDDEMRSVFLNITNQVFSASQTLLFFQRTQAESNRVKELLNNMQQAVFSVSARGTITEPVSAFTKEIFGSDVVKKSIHEILFNTLTEDSEEKTNLETVFSTVFGEPLLQWDLVEHLLPRKVMARTKNGSRVLKINVSPLFDEDQFVDKMMFVIEDITELEKLELEYTAEKKRIQVIQEIAASDVHSLNRNFFERAFQLYTRCEDLKGQIGSNREAYGEVLRNLHTIKGNARLFRFSLISSTIHEAESELTNLPNEGMKALREKTSSIQVDSIFHGIRSTLELYGGVASSVFRLENPFLNLGGVFSSRIKKRDEVFVEVPHRALNDLKMLVSQSGSPALLPIQEKIDQLLDSSVDEEFHRYSSMVDEIANSLGKKAHLQIQVSNLHLNRFVLEMLRDGFVHLIRNSLDHGIESEAERLKKQKKPEGTVTLSAQKTLNQWTFKVMDDGRGIDLEKIQILAREKGLLKTDKSLSEEQTYELLFLPGFSSKVTATELSGRGVGLDMVRNILKALNGQIKVRSIPEKMTEFTITFAVTKELLARIEQSSQK